MILNPLIKSSCLEDHDKEIDVDVLTPIETTGADGTESDQLKNHKYINSINTMLYIIYFLILTHFSVIQRL